MGIDLKEEKKWPWMKNQAKAYKKAILKSLFFVA
tara:strand:+ start:1041 stop:1142 length:102 start_codon:yes stop_codon:yes gene_type:complete